MVVGTYFPISQFPKRHQRRWASTIWEIGKLGNGWRYRFPNFPEDLSPSGSARFGKLGNWEMAGGTDFPISQKISAHQAQHDLGNWEIGKWLEVQISQFPRRSQPIWLSTIWEIGKLGNCCRYRFPNFPISQKISAHLAQHDLGNWEIGKSV